MIQRNKQAQECSESGQPRRKIKLTLFLLPLMFGVQFLAPGRLGQISVPSGQDETAVPWSLPHHLSPVGPPQINLEKFKMLFSLIKEVPGLVKTHWEACPFCQHLRQFLKVTGLPNHARAAPFPSWCHFLSAPSEQWTIRLLHKAPTKPNQTRRYTFLPNASFVIKVGLGSRLSLAPGFQDTHATHG